MSLQNQYLQLISLRKTIATQKTLLLPSSFLSSFSRYYYNSYKSIIYAYGSSFPKKYLLIFNYSPILAKDDYLHSLYIWGI